MDEYLNFYDSYFLLIRIECYDGTVFNWSGDHFNVALGEFLFTGKTLKSIKTITLTNDEQKVSQIL